jgi:hypothetical protein
MMVDGHDVILELNPRDVGQGEALLLAILQHNVY